MAWAAVDDLQKDPIGLETTGLLQLEASTYYIALEAPPGWDPISDNAGNMWLPIIDTGGSGWAPINDIGGGAWTDIDRSGIDDTLVANALVAAAVGQEPQKSQFDVLVDGRKLGDIEQDGTVNVFDALDYLLYSESLLMDQDKIDYIENVMKPYMLANPATYQDYYAGETVWTDITT